MVSKSPLGVGREGAGLALESKVGVKGGDMWVKLEADVFRDFAGGSALTNQAPFFGIPDDDSVIGGNVPYERLFAGGPVGSMERGT
ncbi:hypothetical protein JTE90_029013 [Oedothorax gibbosus]|uniref:Uncharacterized protein n=1 Tax=Oedothorax gibbosus TaxID=931172 RepID=A0AAV6VJF5_9ARAC|nr:hypothetical protein JTE90_029013 [Oedothorax gibbosus]